MNRVFPWADEQVADLRRLHAQGLSASVICEMLGAPSRSTICGKLARLGLKGNRKPGVVQQKHTAKRIAPRSFVAVNAQRLIKRREDAPGVESLPAEPVGSTAMTIVDLRTGVCRWPLWGLEAIAVEEKFYCGAPTGGLYCDRHGARATA